MLGRTKARRRDAGFRGWIFVVEMLALACVAGLLAAHEPVVFDVAPAVMGRPLAQNSAAPGHEAPGHEAVEVQVSVSTLVDPNRRAPLTQLLYRFTSRQGRSTVLDFSPRTELISAVDGPVEVTVTDEMNQHSGLQVGGDYQKWVRAEGAADQATKNSQCTKYRRAPPVDSVVASGTISQTHGVYFKLKAAHDRTLEGDKTFRLVLQLPIGWRNELLEVSLQAWGHGVQSRQPLVTTNLLIAVWREGDESARRAAERLATAVVDLRSSATRYDQAIRHRAYPTLFHKVGAALEVMEPKIPGNWMDQVLLTDVDPYHDRKLSELPVDVRVAILDYQDARGQLLEMN